MKLLDLLIPIALLFVGLGLAASWHWAGMLLAAIAGFWLSAWIVAHVAPVKEKKK